jgi:hypothetical protein
MAEYEYIYSKIRPGQPWVEQKVVPRRQARLNSTIPIIIIKIIIMHFSTMLI